MYWIEIYQNIANLLVSGYTVYVLCTHNPIITDDTFKFTGGLNIALPLIASHFMTDLFITNNLSIRIHHLLGLTILGYNYWQKVDMITSYIPTIALYNTEISTIFLVTKLFSAEIKSPNLLMKSFILTNDILFFLTFFKFRIWDYFHMLVLPEFTGRIAKYPNNWVIYFALHGLFILNLYWFIIICKIIIKPVIKIIPDNVLEFTCHNVTSYTMFFNFAIGFYLYLYHLRLPYILELFGLLILAVNSWRYHSFVTKKIIRIMHISSQYVVDYSDLQTKFYFLGDIMSIHIRSYLSLIINYWFYSPKNTGVYMFSGLLHLIGFGFGIDILKQIDYELLRDQDKLKLFIHFQYCCVGIPVAIDILLIYAHSYHILYSLLTIYTMIIIILLFIVMPAYQLTHILVHNLLICMTICIINTNLMITPAPL
jgi:hypothetical protein